MAEQQPSIGRVVHFVYGETHVPAIIIDPEYHLIEPAAHETPIQVGLVVFTLNNAPFTTTAVFDPAGKPGTWHWPEYVPAK